MIAALAPAVRALKRLLRRCDQEGCWRRGQPCWEMDLTDLTAPSKGWRTCEHHLDLERRAEVEKQRHDPKIIVPGDRVRAVACAKPEECAKHGNHEGVLASTTYSRKVDPLRSPLEPIKPGDLLFHIDSDEGVHYHAVKIVKIAGGSDEERRRRHVHCDHQKRT